MIQTTASILRERIKKLNGKEFTLQDLLYYDPYIVDNDAFCRAAASSLSHFASGQDSEVIILRTERLANKVKVNVYKENKLKVIKPKFKKELAGATTPKAFEVWKDIWPDMFVLPKFKSKRVGVANSIGW